MTEEEHRKGYILGISPGQLLTMVVTIATLLVTFGLLIGDINSNKKTSEANTKSIEKISNNSIEEINRIRDDYKNDITRLSDSLNLQIRESEIRTRGDIRKTYDDIREIRKLLQNKILEMNHANL